jgi:hypothetical protein
VNAYRQHQDTAKQLEEARVYLKEEAASDPDMAGEDVTRGLCHSNSTSRSSSSSSSGCVWPVAHAL